MEKFACGTWTQSSAPTPSNHPYSGQESNSESLPFCKVIFYADIKLQAGQGGGKRNPIYLFYEQVDVNQNGKLVKKVINTTGAIMVARRS